VRVLVDNTAPFSDVTSPVRVLGTEGATVFTAAGDASIQVPSFSFDGERRVTIERRDDAGAAGGAAYELGPAGLTLGKLGTLDIALPAGVQDNGDLAIHHFENGTWKALGGTRENRVGGASYSLGVTEMGLYALRTTTGVPSGPSMISALQAEPRHFKPHSGSAERVAVSFVLGQPAQVNAIVYNRAGRPRRVLLDGVQMGGGQQVVFWDGRDKDGQIVASALYIICVEAGGERVTKVVTVGHD